MVIVFVNINNLNVDPGGPVVITLATGAEIRGFKPGVKILSKTSSGSEVKPWVPCRRFTARKRTQAEIRASEQNLSDFPRSP